MVVPRAGIMPSHLTSHYSIILHIIRSFNAPISRYICIVSMDYDRIPSNWTLKFLLNALGVEHKALNPLFADVREFFANNTDITSLKTHASKKRISAEAKTLRARYNDLFANVPTGSKVDKECVEGCMKFIFNSNNSGRAQIKSETPAPQATPVSSSPGQKSARADSIPTLTLPDEIPEHRLIIDFSRQNSPEVPPLEASPQLLVDRNPSRSEMSAVRLVDVTKAAIIELLMEENIMQSEEDLIWGVKEDGVASQLLSDARVVGFLRARCLSGYPRAFITITPGMYSSLTAAGFKNSHIGQLFLSPRLQLIRSPRPQLILRPCLHLVDASEIYPLEEDPNHLVLAWMLHFLALNITPIRRLQTVKMQLKKPPIDVSGGVALFKVILRPYLRMMLWN